MSLKSKRKSSSLKDKSKIKWTGSSEYLKKSIDLTKVVNLRFQIFVGLICFFMGILLARLYFIQIVQNSAYVVKLENYRKTLQTVTTPRGEIMDRNGQVLVGSRQRLNIIYYPPQGVTERKKWGLAYNFSFDFAVSGSELHVRDLKDLYLATRTDSFASWIKENEFNQYAPLISEEEQIYYESLITEEEWGRYRAGELTSMDLYYLRLSRIKESDYEKLDDALRSTWVIKQAMDAPTSGQTKNILSDVSSESVAFLMEHNESYPGFDVEIDWDRQYPYGNTLKSVFGSVTTSKQGLPAEGLDNYLALGYSRNEKVGRSGLEQQYEALLAGERKVYDLSYDEDGLGVLTEVVTGSKGLDLETAIDIHLQMETDQILANILKQYENDPRRQYMNRILVVVMDPNNGDVLTLSSMVRGTSGEVYADPVATYTMAYEAGSTVKGAMIYMGQNEGVIRLGETLLDQSVKLRGTQTKSSWKNLGYINDIQALAQSSNVYMILTAIRLAGGIYSYDGPLSVAPGTFSLMRNYFSQFGLGVKTGIDIPNETTGYSGSATESGNILDFAIGQYDTYTVMQLAQYASVLANGGIKYQPRLVTKAYKSGTSEVVYENDVTILTTLDNKESLQRIQRGLLECVYGTHGICKGIQNSAAQTAAKTGTAQAYVKEENKNGDFILDPVTGQANIIQAPTNTVIAYAPYDQPEISIACLIPNAWNGDKSQPNLCLEITKEIIETYYGHQSVFDDLADE